MRSSELRLVELTQFVIALFKQISSGIQSENRHANSFHGDFEL